MRSVHFFRTTPHRCDFLSHRCGRAHRTGAVRIFILPLLCQYAAIDYLFYLHTPLMNSTLLRKSLELSITSHCSRQQIKFNFTSMKPAGIVIILVTAYQLSIAAVVNRYRIVT